MNGHGSIRGDKRILNGDSLIEDESNQREFLGRCEYAEGFNHFGSFSRDFYYSYYKKGCTEKKERREDNYGVDYCSDDIILNFGKMILTSNDTDYNENRVYEQEMIPQTKKNITL